MSLETAFSGAKRAVQKKGFEIFGKLIRTI